MSLVNCCFLKITGMFLIKVHSIFESQTVYYAFPFQVYNFCISFWDCSIIPLPHYYTDAYRILKKSVCLCGAFSALYKEYASQSILSPWALFTNIHHSNKQRAWCNHAHQCICVQMSWRLRTRYWGKRKVVPVSKETQLLFLAFVWRWILLQVASRMLEWGIKAVLVKNDYNIGLSEFTSGLVCKSGA